MKINATGDTTRDKCAELIYDALAFDSGARKQPSALYLHVSANLLKRLNSY